MSAMEKMVAQMLGITPEGISNMVTGFQDMMVKLKAQLDRIEEKVDAIAGSQIGTIEGTENVDGNDANRSDAN